MKAMSSNLGTVLLNVFFFPQEDLKPVIVREALTFTLERKDMPDPSEESIKASIKV